MKQRLERLVADMDFVPREEFEAVKAMAAKAREENEALSARLAASKPSSTPGLTPSRKCRMTRLSSPTMNSCVQNPPPAKLWNLFRRGWRGTRGLLCHRKILCQFGSQLLRVVLGKGSESSGMTFTHQDEMAFAPHPIDMLERTVEDNGWAFERSGRDELNLSVAGKWSDHHFSFTWRDDLKSLHLSSTFDMRITEGVHRQNVADLLMYVNAQAVDRPFRPLA